MNDPVLAALADTQRRLADTQRRLAAALSEADYERRRRHHAEQLLDQAHRVVAEQHQLIEDLGRRPAGRVAA